MLRMSSIEDREDDRLRWGEEGGEEHEELSPELPSSRLARFLSCLGEPSGLELVDSTPERRQWVEYALHRTILLVICQ